ncbi:MAG TPA: C4-dicarboxylate ABC transporter [Streptomyces sp.]|nr:C4-dicarboxylate ABC transporter [Streptomyces sp.]
MVHSLSLLALVAIFAVATVAPVNMGILAFVGAFLIGALSGVSVGDVFSAFPGDTFVLVVGITLLFGVARVNGTVDLVVAASLKLVHGRRWAIVWLMFILSGVLMSLGSVLAVGMLAPIAMPIAARHGIKPLLMGMMLSHGALGAAFSPITVYGAFTSGMVKKAGIDVSPLLLFAVPFALNVLIAAVLFAVLGRDLRRRGGAADRITSTDVIGDAGIQGFSTTPVGTSAADNDSGGTVTAVRPAHSATSTRTVSDVAVTPIRILTLLGIVGLVVGAGALQLDTGVSALVIGAILLLVAPHAHKESTDDIGWGAVLLVCGMITYMAVLTENGTLDMIGDSARALGSPLLAALVLCFIVAIVSAFGSSIGTLGIALPIAFPLLADGGIGAVGFVVALAFCSTVVDVSPFSTNGVIVLDQAQVPDKQRFQRSMFGYTVLIIIGAPLLIWAIAILPTSP